jgi:hypothetical protein
VEGYCHIGVVFAEGLLLDRQGTLVEPLCVRVLAFRLVYGGQAVEGCGVIGMVNAKFYLDACFELLGFDEGRGVVGLSIQAA